MTQNESELMDCPADWVPSCVCNSSATEPNDKCFLHGSGNDIRRCPYCGLFRWGHPCSRCNCKWGLHIFNRSAEATNAPQS